MTQEEKDLLLKDLCSRLPYKVKASYYGAEEECECWDEVEGIVNDYVEIGQYSLPIEAVKPYLFPLSSMTDEQIEEAKTYFWKDVDYGKSLVDKGINCFYPCFNILEFYHQNHIDYRGLIEKSLALDATNLNIY